MSIHVCEGLFKKVVKECSQSSKRTRTTRNYRSNSDGLLVDFPETVKDRGPNFSRWANKGKGLFV